VKRDMLGPLERSGVSQAGCRGAALLAGLAAGVYETTDQFPEPRNRSADRDGVSHDQW